MRHTRVIYNTLIEALTKESLSLTLCFSCRYVAPEVLRQVGHGKPVDLWSVGVIMYTLLCGYAPFWGENQAALFEAIILGKYEFEDEYWSNISELGMLD